jgi:uncharacterized protein YjiS (DUF1127 family)
MIKQDLYGEFRLLSLDPRHREYRRVGRSSGAAAIAFVSSFAGGAPRRSEARHFALLAAIRRITAALRLWRRRARARRQLPALSDHLLKDIGLRRDALGYEFQTPFRRPDRVAFSRGREIPSVKQPARFS